MAHPYYQILGVPAPTKENIITKGMVLIPGVNDEAYAKYIASLPPVEEQVMISVVDNRW
jgi:hypothetical protein